MAPKKATAAAILETPSNTAVEKSHSDTVVDRRIDIFIVWDITAGSPQGDPAQLNNRPREDIDTGNGMFTDAGWKRHIRDYIMMAYEGKEGLDIHIRQKAILSEGVLDAQTKLGIKPADAQKDANQTRVRDAMCKSYFDVRAFGEVVAHSTATNSGKITGPVQFTHFWSQDPLDTMEIKGTRVAVANQERSDSMAGFNQDFSIKYVVPYALFHGNGFVSPFWAKKTGFTWGDYEVLIEAMKNLFENRRTSSSGLRTTRKIIAFEHSTHLGCAPAADLFDLVKIVKKNPDKPARAYSDYEITIDEANLPAGVTVKVY